MSRDSFRPMCPQTGGWAVLLARLLLMVLMMTLISTGDTATQIDELDELSNLKNARLLFIGDSITASNPKDPSYSQATHRYVTAFDTLLRLKHPGLGVQIIDKGVGGHTVEHLRQRWEDDVIQQKPDWLIVLIGINDAAYLFQHQTQAPAQYEGIYDRLLTETRQQLPDVQIVLMTPFLIAVEDSLPPDSDNGKIITVLSQYIDVVQRLGQKHDAAVIDLHAAFQELLKHEDAKWLADEPVHPGERGKLFIAMQLLDHLEAAAGSR